MGGAGGGDNGACHVLPYFLWESMHYKQQYWPLYEGLNFCCAIPVLPTLTHPFCFWK